MEKRIEKKDWKKPEVVTLNIKKDTFSSSGNAWETTRGTKVVKPGN